MRLSQVARLVRAWTGLQELEERPVRVSLRLEEGEILLDGWGSAAREWGRHRGEEDSFWTGRRFSLPFDPLQ